jgi:hypothetical protein
LNTKQTTTYDVGNPDPGLGQAHKCGGVKPVNGIRTLPSCQWNLLQQYIYKQKLSGVCFLRHLVTLIYLFSDNVVVSFSMEDSSRTKRSLSSLPQKLATTFKFKDTIVSFKLIANEKLVSLPPVYQTVSGNVVRIPHQHNVSKC